MPPFPQLGDHPIIKLPTIEGFVAAATPNPASGKSQRELRRPWLVFIDAQWAGKMQFAGVSSSMALAPFHYWVMSTTGAVRLLEATSFDLFFLTPVIEANGGGSSGGSDGRDDWRCQRN